MLTKRRENRILNKKNVIGIIIAAIMVMSILGSWEGNYVRLDKYNEYKFKLKDDKVITEINGKEVFFDYHPSELENLSISPAAVQMFKDAIMIYLTFDPDDEYITEIEKGRMDFAGFNNEFRKYVMVGVTANSTDYQLLPIITCQNATTYIPVIYLRKAPENAEAIVWNDGTCVHIEANYGFEFNAFKEKIRYILYGIMN